MPPVYAVAVPLLSMRDDPFTASKITRRLPGGNAPHRPPAEVVILRELGTETTLREDNLVLVGEPLEAAIRMALHDEPPVEPVARALAAIDSFRDIEIDLRPWPTAPAWLVRSVVPRRVDENQPPPAKVPGMAA